MMKSVIALAALAFAAGVAPAQMPGSAAKAAAQKAAAAANAHTAAEQNTDQQPQQKAGAKTQAPTKAAPAPVKTAPAQKGAQKTPATKAPASKASTAQKGAKTIEKPAVPAADTAGPPPTILREAYAYASEGRRDPFNSLLTTNELRPTLSDLRITGILYDAAGRRSTATLRDLVTNAQYRVVVGNILGRMRIAAIRPKIIVFTIDEFGTTRQDSLVFGDTTKARVK